VGAGRDRLVLDDRPARRRDRNDHVGAADDLLEIARSSASTARLLTDSGQILLAGDGVLPAYGGYMEGAVRAGQLAAQRCLDAQPSDR
jgi:hypothetical protein